MLQTRICFGGRILVWLNSVLILLLPGKSRLVELPDTIISVKRQKNVNRWDIVSIFVFFRCLLAFRQTLNFVACFLFSVWLWHIVIIVEQNFLKMRFSARNAELKLPWLQVRHLHLMKCAMHLTA